MVSENGRYRGLLMDWGGVLTSDVFASFSAFCELEGLEPDAVAGRMEISTYGGKTDYGKRDLYASESILEAARDAYDRLGGPNPHRLTAPDADGCAVPGEQLAADVELIEYTEAQAQIYDRIYRASVAWDRSDPIRQTDR